MAMQKVIKAKNQEIAEFRKELEFLLGEMEKMRRRV